jgi:hypothetical protein
MRRVPLLAPSAWVAATAIATVVSWLGVGAVTRAVTAAPEPVIPAATIAHQHAHLNMTLPIEQLVEAPASSATTTTVPIEVREPTPTIVVPTPIVPAPTVSTTTVPTTPPPSGSKTSGSGSGSGSGTGTGTGGPPPPQPETQTFTDAGGTMTATCTGSTIAFDSSVPSNGYEETTESTGPTLVEVSFSEGKKIFFLEAQCSSGLPVAVPPSGWGVNPPQGSQPNPGQF